MSELFRARVVGVAQMHGHLSGESVLHVRDRGVERSVARIRLRRQGQVGDRFGQRNPSFGHADILHCRRGGHRDGQRLRVGHADVLGRGDDDAAGDEARVLTRDDHPRQIVQGRVDIGAANGFDERGDHVVVLVAVAVIAQNGLAARFRACGFGDRDRFVARLLRLGGRDSGGGFEDGQRPAGVGSGDADDEVPGLLGEGELSGQPAIGFDGTVEQIADRLVVERTQGEHERPRQQRRDDGERRVLRGCGHEHDEPILHGRQQGVLLSLGEAVDLVEEQHVVRPYISRSRRAFSMTCRTS